MYRCIVKNKPNDENYNGLRRSLHATLTVTYNCAVDGHVYGDGVVTENPTCTTEPGVRTYTCSVCDSTKTERIEPTVTTTKKQPAQKEPHVKYATQNTEILRLIHT